MQARLGCRRLRPRARANDLRPLGGRKRRPHLGAGVLAQGEPLHPEQVKDLLVGRLVDLHTVREELGSGIDEQGEVLLPEESDQVVALPPEVSGPVECGEKALQVLLLETPQEAEPPEPILVKREG